MAKSQYDPRRARPGERYEFADADGTLHTLTADDDGVIQPRDESEVAALSHLPVARKALTDDERKES